MLYMFSMVLPSLMLCCFPGSAVWEIKPTQQVHLKELVSRDCCVRLCQTVALFFFSQLALLLEQDFMESIQNACQCNIGKFFVYV